MPIVSIIIPVYNVEDYLRDCMDSIINQTLFNIEIVCVNDGSTDSSLDILENYAKNDSRIVILQQDNRGAACARNLGLQRAKGKYVIFLDSDDVFSNRLLEKSVEKAEMFKADITIFKAVSFDTNNGNKAIMKDKISKLKTLHNSTFTYADIPDSIFNSFLIPAWNKLFTRDFLIRNKIVFQDIKRYNDLFFTNKALVLASKIVLLDEVLLYYRVGMKSNLQAGKDKTPLEVCKALGALKDYLQEEKLYENVEKSYLKLALDNIFYNLNEIKSIEGRKHFIFKLRNEAFEYLNIKDNKKLKSVSYLGYIQYRYINLWNNRFISGALYAIDKIYEYYKLTGLENMIKKVILKS